MHNFLRPQNITEDEKDEDDGFDKLIHNMNWKQKL